MAGIEPQREVRRRVPKLTHHIRRALTNTLLAGASAEVEALRLEGHGGPIPVSGSLVPSFVSFTQRVTDLDHQVDRAAKALTSWHHALAEVRSKRASDLRAADAYSNTMRGHISQYNGLRATLQNDVDHISAGTTYTNAYQLLGDAVSARQSLKTSIDQLCAVAGMGPAQNQIAHVLDESLNAVSDASTGVSDYQFSGEGEYLGGYTTTPGWEQFVSLSDQLTRDFSSATSNWESQMGHVTSSIKKRVMPARPNV